MVEFKFTAQRLNGQSISGTLSGVSVSDGKKKIQRLAEKNKLKITTVQKKSTYLYRVRKGNEKPIRGEQKAFSKREVEEALIKENRITSWKIKAVPGSMLSSKVKDAKGVIIPQKFFKAFGDIIIVQDIDFGAPSSEVEEE